MNAAPRTLLQISQTAVSYCGIRSALNKVLLLPWPLDPVGTVRNRLLVAIIMKSYEDAEETYLLRTVWLTLSALACIGTLTAGWPARAEERIVVRAGDSPVVARKTHPITNEKANLGSVAKIVQGTDPGAMNVVIYLPPAGANEVEDAVQFTVEGQTVTVPITVKAADPRQEVNAARGKNGCNEMATGLVYSRRGRSRVARAGSMRASPVSRCGWPKCRLESSRFDKSEPTKSL